MISIKIRSSSSPKITKQWIAGIRKSFKKMSAVPTVKKLSDFALFLNGVKYWMDRLEQDLMFNKGLWQYKTPKYKSMLTQKKLDLMAKFEAATVIVNDATDYYGDWFDFVYKDEAAMIPFEIHLREDLVEDAAKKGMTLEEYAIYLCNLQFKESMEDLDSIVSGKLLRLLTSHFTYLHVPEYDREFTLGKVKVVFEDTTASHNAEDRDPYHAKDYVKPLQNAQQLLRRKKLDKLWYGLIAIQCEKCGGENVYGKHLGGRCLLLCRKRPNRDLQQPK